MTASPQATFVVEYPCDLFCRIEIEVAGEHSQVTLEQMWAKADEQHRHIHEPDAAAEPTPAAEPEALRRPAATVFQAAPGGPTESPELPRGPRGPRRHGRR
ncbi:hypothetical protein AB0J83_30285 [Actinoplanes sp. NPDC049596]|uniref:hypothetical protein n=1 Tax=unclassified Actinoplanes TaxID=2626549 RepID=UPI00341E2EC1